MKYFFTAACLAVTLMCKAQLVNIPDSNFKYWLLQHIDLNSDGQIQTSEAIAATAINIENIDNHPIHDLTGIRSFVNVKRFYSAYNNIENMDLTGLDSLQEFATTEDTITNLNLTGCNNLKTFTSNTCWLRDFNFSGFPNLTTIDMHYNKGTSLTVLNCPSLQTINGATNQISNLTIHNCENLETITWLYGRLTELAITALPQLHSLWCDGNLLTELTLPDLPKLNIFRCASNLFRSLDIRNYSSLETIDCESNEFLKNLHLENLHRLKNVQFSTDGGVDSIEVKQCDSIMSVRNTVAYIKYLALSGCHRLKSLDIFVYAGIELDLSDCINLDDIIINQAENLLHLNIKNGRFNNCLNSILAPSLRYVCADDDEIITVLNNLINSGNSNVAINSYCSFIPGGDYNTIKGKVRVDNDNNGCTSTDPGIQNLIIRLNDTSGESFSSNTNTSGNYSVFTNKGSFTLNPYFPYPYFNIIPGSINIGFDTANNLLNTTDFCITANGIHNDLEITFLPSWPAARPGFDAGYSLVYKNRGTTTLSGNLQLNFDNGKMNFISASENVTAQSTGQLIWNYSNLQPFESRTIDVNFTLLPPPVNNIGDTIIYLAAITPSANDETAYDNSFILPQRVRSSIDPNEKQCLEGSKVDISKINDYLHYQIHFQNEGTDTAFNIVVADTLSDKLDWNTLELISSSHPVDVRLKNNKAEFIFENIKLPYKAINEPASNGYVAFKIKPKPSVVIGDSLNNTAAIYFDFNRPVITNKAITIVASASIPVPVKVEYFSISSRDNINTLNWKAACTNGSARFSIERSDDGIHFSSIGNITATTVRCQLPFSFRDNDPVTGKNYYRLKITDADGISFYSKVLAIGNNKAGLQITAITNNIVYFNNYKQQSIQLKVIAADGKIILADNKKLAAGSNSISLQVKTLSKGIYTLMIYTSNGETITKRFIQ